MMRIKAAVSALSLLALVSCQTPGATTYDRLGSVEDHDPVRFFYPSGGGNIEAYVTRPEGEGPFPLVILLHGHSFFGRGAEQVLGAAQTFASQGCFATLSISLPGYGASDDVESSVVDATRRAVKDGVAFAKQLDWVDKRHLFFYGVSRGAIIAAALANEIAGVEGAVLYAGAYDLERLYRDTPSFWVRKILNPNGEVNPKFINLLGDGIKWTVPALILHGAQDRVIPVNQAEMLRDRLRAAGVDHQLVVYPDRGHFLPRQNVRERSIKFFKKFVAPACPAGKPV
jgi:dipeptidyl aminopeptidase/acylaminoacyl peptidase